MKKNHINKIQRVQIAVIGVVFILLLELTRNPHIWQDEAFTMKLVRYPISRLIEFTALDVHPPLYYLIIKLFITILGESMLVFHLPSLLCYITLLIISVLFFNKYFDGRIAFLVLAALVSVPQMLYYALEIRMYSMSALFITAGFYLTYMIMEGCKKQSTCKLNSKWIMLILVHVLAAYTHYFAGVAAVGTSIFLLINLLLTNKTKPKQILTCWGTYVIGMAILYLPWLFVLVKQMQQVGTGYWIKPIDGAALHGYFNFFIQMDSESLKNMLTVFFIIGVGLVIYDYQKKTKQIWYTGGYFIYFVFMAFGIGYSVLATPILIDRYQFVLIPLIWIPIMISFGSRKNNYLHAVIIVILSLCFLGNYRTLYNSYTNINDAALLEVENRYMEEDDAFFCIWLQELAICNAYFPEREVYAYEWIDTGLIFGECNLVSDAEELKNFEHDIWLLNNDFMEAFLNVGYQVEEISVGDKMFYKLSQISK